MPEKSYIEPQDLPTKGLSTLSSALDIIRFGNVAHNEKPDVIVVRESFLLRDKSGSKIGVFTRSPEDHRATVGDCRVLVNGDFMRNQAITDNNGKVCYNTSARLHEHLGPFSSQFRPAKTDDSILIHFINPLNNRKYIFIIFEMICEDFPPPLYIKLNGRRADSFVGLHDRITVNAGIKRYNKSTTEIDETLISAMKPKLFGQAISSSIFRGEFKNSLVSNNLTILKFNLIGIG
jgi:hypothetical protein